jgi:hypothetical protein
MIREPDLFPELDELWFYDHSTVKDPGAAWQVWEAWLCRSRRSEFWTRFCKLLEIAGGVVRASVQHYLSPNEWQQLSDRTLWDLDYISHVLGVELPRRERFKPRTRRDVR